MNYLEITVNELDSFFDKLDSYSNSKIEWCDLGWCISFDKQWRPFIGESIGYNRDYEKREYLPICPLLSKVKSVLSQLHDRYIPGGRYFFSNKGIYTCRDGKQIAKWDIK